MIAFTVAGLPVPQGSKSVNRATGFMYEANKQLMPWRQEVIAQAHRARGDQPTILGPVQVTMTFTFPRPKGHFGTGRNAGVLKPGAPDAHASKPDLDKCTRAVLDAVTIAGVWRDDAQACHLQCRKAYGAQPGVEVHILSHHDQPTSGDEGSEGAIEQPSLV